MNLPNHALTNYIFPNNIHIDWSLMIVVYPYITGLIAGAFVVSALYHVFKVNEFRSVSKFALVASLCFGLFAGLPLLVHLGQPQRAFNIYFTPHLTSAMSLFGYVYGAYMILLMIEIWLIYRAFIIEQAKKTKNFIWKALTLGVMTYTHEASKIDHKLLTVLAGLGIPGAFLLHGYVGFVFGSVKAKAWWATPLQPLIFLMSAIVSGIAVLALMYAFIKWWNKEEADYSMIRKLMTYLWGIFIIDYALELLEVISVFYEQGHHWAVVGPLLAGPLASSYWIYQMGILSITPLILLGIVVLANLKNRIMYFLSLLSSLLLVLQVLFMRFNVVIGGQLISNSDRGFVDFHFNFIAKEGVLTSIAIMIMPFITYYLITRFIPVFDKTASAEEKMI